MSDFDALMASILASPMDDAPRLIFADFLDEQGTKASMARASFIRSQIRLFRDPPKPNCRDGHFEFALGKYTHHCRCEYCKLRRAEWYAWRQHHCDWYGDFISPIVNHEVAESLRTHQPMTASTPAKCEFSRGFISSITLSCEDFLRHAAVMFTRYPIESVSLSDKDPLGIRDETETGKFRWNEHLIKVNTGVFFDIPSELFRLLPTGRDCVLVRDAHLDWNSRFSVRDYVSRLSAHYALNVACTIYGRRAAGLVPL